MPAECRAHIPGDLQDLAQFAGPRFTGPKVFGEALERLWDVWALKLIN
jgi:hypothetical protein